MSDKKRIEIILEPDHLLSTSTVELGRFFVWSDKCCIGSVSFSARIVCDSERKDEMSACAQVAADAAAVLREWHERMIRDG